MKKIILTIAVMLLFVTASFAQKSDYNKHISLNQTNELGIWIQGTQSEMYMTKPSAVGYGNVYNELRKVLNFYGMDFDNPNANNTILDNSKLTDFKGMYYDLVLENAEVKMGWWTKDLYCIAWYCGKDINAVTISKLPKL
jgi:hypothetical protein